MAHRGTAVWYVELEGSGRSCCVGGQPFGGSLVYRISCDGGL